MMHFPPVSDLPLFSTKFSDSVENFQNFTFSRNIFRFSYAKISNDLFLIIDHKFRISLIFALFQYISLCFAKIIISLPTLKKFPPVFENFTCLSHTLCVFRFTQYAHWVMHLCITHCANWTPLVPAYSRTLCYATENVQR